MCNFKNVNRVIYTKKKKKNTVPFIQACLYDENSSYKWSASYFCSWLVEMLDCSSNSNPTSCVFQSYAVMLRFAAKAIFWRPFLGSLLFMTKTVICRRIIGNNALLEKFKRSLRKTGRDDWHSGLSVSLSCREWPCKMLHALQRNKDYL